jgi:hypothetical protein
MPDEFDFLREDTYVEVLSQIPYRKVPHETATLPNERALSVIRDGKARDPNRSAPKGHRIAPI